MNKKNVIIMACGASLTIDQAAIAQSARQKGVADIIAVNRAFELTAPDIIYAADGFIWDTYHDKMPSCSKITQDKKSSNAYRLKHVAHKHGIKGMPTEPMTLTGRNSGYQAICLAAHLGYKTIILLGFDMQPTDGKIHFHEDHPQNNGPKDWSIWINQFDQLASDLKKRGIAVMNSSTSTALTQFPLVELQKAFSLLY